LLAMMMMIKKRNEIRGSELLNGDEKADWNGMHHH
jgi:hypothetical protein